MSQEPYADDRPLPEQPPTVQAVESLTNEERTFGMLAHLAALAAYIVPFGNVLGPLVVWLVKKDTSPYVDYHGKEALNFQLSILLYFLISIPIGILTCGIGFILTGAIVVFKLVMLIIAAIKANKGERYRYPLTIRMIT